MNKERLYNYLDISPYSDIPELLLELKRWADHDTIIKIADILTERFIKDVINRHLFLSIFLSKLIRPHHYKVTSTSDIFGIPYLNTALDKHCFRWMPINEYWFKLVKTLLLKLGSYFISDENLCPEDNQEEKEWYLSWYTYLYYENLYDVIPKKDLPKIKNRDIELIKRTFIDTATVRFLYGFSPELWGYRLRNDSTGTPNITECTEKYSTSIESGFSIPWTDPPLFLKDLVEKWIHIRTYTSLFLHYDTNLSSIINRLTLPANISLTTLKDHIIKSLYGQKEYSLLLKLPFNNTIQYFPDIEISYDGLGVGYYNPRGLVRLQFQR